MGCINCKKQRGVNAAVRTPSSHSLPFQYLQQQKVHPGVGPVADPPSTTKGSPGTGTGSETHQGAEGSVESLIESPATFGSASPPACDEVEEKCFPQEQRTDDFIHRAEGSGCTEDPTDGLTLCKWPEGIGEHEERRTSSSTPQPDCAGAPTTRTQHQRPKVTDVIIPMRSNDYYGYRHSSRASPLSQSNPKQKQLLQREGRKDLSIETLACVRRGFDACVNRDTEVAEAELQKAEGLLAALRVSTNTPGILAVLGAVLPLHQSTEAQQ
ncbi:hypothetical protein cyc_04731 [Cyclospora cayetanensis]|uniref:Uncharacterized protein n=1 Tax=Cyclospora cayetanensis TaxID=88456 RepID=A0A1D3D545_9EIME|nr:hypothetical protein cyc_04731 [Cyclospora cayetanensis]